MAFFTVTVISISLMLGLSFVMFVLAMSVFIERFSLDCRKGLVLVLVLVLLRPLVG